MVGLSGFGPGTGMGGVSPYANQQPGMLSNQQFQDPNAWMTQMLQAQPGLAGTSASPVTPGATVGPAQAAMGAPTSPTGGAQPDATAGLGGLLASLFGQGGLGVT